MKGDIPKRLVGTVFVVTEIFKKKEGLFNHFIESKELADVGKSIMDLHNIEYNQNLYDRNKTYALGVVYKPSIRCILRKYA